MLSPRVTIDESYRACRQVVRASGSNFAWSFCLLPADKRRAMHALYAFARVVDDLGDGDGSPSERRGALAAWREGLTCALAGESFSHLDLAAHDVLPAVAHAAETFRIPPQLLLEIIAGVERDLEQNRYATWEELQGYCYQVAGVVGLACLHIWGVRGEVPVATARQCGEAFQLTNILRDLGEDARRDRVYLPLDELEASGYSVEELKRGVANEGFDRLMAFQLERAEQLYREAALLHDRLWPDGRRVFRLMLGRYWALLAAIRRSPREVLARRLSLTLPHKLWIGGQCLLARRLRWE